MSARPIGEIVTRVLGDALGMARLQHFLNAFDPPERRQWIGDWVRDGTINIDEAHLLIEHNEMEAT